MNEKMKVTMLFKTINYTNEMKVSRVGGAAGRRQLIKSLKHSLRIPSHSAKHLEWIEEMSHKNLIWTAKTGIVPLNDFSIARRESLLKDVAGQAQLCILGNDDKSLLVRLRTKLKDSIKKFSKREVEETTIRVLQTIINVKGFVDVEKLVDELACTSINRKAQKLNTVKTFLECHNEIEKSGKFFVKRNNAVIQEAFFKFPSRNKVAGILPEQRMDLIKGFYEQLFPDYPIHFIVLHGDEDVERSDYSDHPHIFLSAKSSKTGLFDLKAAQVRRVNSYLKRFRPTVKLISDKPDFLESQAMFGYLQDMFYAYTNNKLLKDSPYQAKKLDKTVEHMEKLRLIRRDSCKPKSQRAFNIYELSKAKELELNIRILSKNDELTRLEQEAEHVKTCVKESTKAAQAAQEMAAVAFEKLELNQKKLSEVGSELESVEMKHKAAVNDFISQELKLNLFMSNIGAMIESFMLWIESAYSQRRCTLDNKYIENIGQHYNAIVDNDSTVGKTFVNSADATLEAQMDYMEKLIGSFSGAPSRKIITQRIKRKTVQ